MIKIKTPEEIEIMAESGKILAEVLPQIVEKSREGISLRKLDKLTERLIKRAGAEPAFLNYQPEGARKPYKASICTSLNETVVHGFPDEYLLKSGDILKLDFGVAYKGFNTDRAVTILIGNVSRIAVKLVKATEKALNNAIKKCFPGNTLGDIGYEIEKTARNYGFKIIHDLTGHGIGRELHEDPTIYNYGEKNRGLMLEPGMVLALEPMFSLGTEKVIQGKDDSWITIDKSLSAHFEHTVAITGKGPRILTL